MVEGCLAFEGGAELALRKNGCDLRGDAAADEDRARRENKCEVACEAPEEAAKEVKGIGCQHVLAGKAVG
jgi:hypothetical protein